MPGTHIIVGVRHASNILDVAPVVVTDFVASLRPAVLVPASAATVVIGAHIIVLVRAAGNLVPLEDEVHAPLVDHSR